MDSTDGSGVKRISANLPQKLVDALDELKKEWGIRSRGQVLERLLEDIFDDLNTSNNLDPNIISSDIENQYNQSNFSNYNENKAIVLIGNSNLEIKESIFNQSINEDNINSYENITQPSAIDLPGFVRKKTIDLKKGLKRSKSNNVEFDSCINTVKEEDIKNSLYAAKEHWLTLYGNKPGENVVEAAMTWLARDIWPHIDGSENTSFTWSGANKLMNQYCPHWKSPPSYFENVIVMAGVLEDPFASNNLKNRIPTIIRRFVNRFKRSQNVTSFQTIESTMTVHGALKLLGLPTAAGSSVTLKSIRDSYKQKALENHPDSGGTTEMMRKLNEAYQLLKDLYKKK